MLGNRRGYAFFYYGDGFVSVYKVQTSFSITSVVNDRDALCLPPVCSIAMEAGAGTGRPFPWRK